MTASPTRSAAARLIALALLLSAGAVWQSSSVSALHDEQIWGHLRAGNWILENRAWPHSGLFSQAANLPWRDFTWAYDVAVALKYSILGLRAIPALVMGFRFLLAAIAFALAGGFSGNFWSALGLSVVAQYVLAVMGPGPTCASVVLFGTELLLLLRYRSCGDPRLLYVLPPLFLFWTNLDLGFVYGIGLYVFFLIGLSLDRTRWFETPRAPIPRTTAWVVGAACVLASVATPYDYRGYGAFFAEQRSVINDYLLPYKAMSFHRPQDYVFLLLTMSAFLALGLRRSRNFFLFASLLAAASLAFYAQRDAWLAVLLSLAAIGEPAVLRETRERSAVVQLNVWQMLAAAFSVILIFLAFLRLPRRQDQLLAKVADTNPVAAADYVRRHGLPQPLFNAYRWGSFLTWYLPEYPVAIDARRGLYPEKQEAGYFRVMKLDVSYQTFEPIVRARTLLLDKGDVMAEALRDAPGFQVAYEDRLAIVLLQAAKE